MSGFGVKKRRIDWQPPRGWIRFDQIRNLAAEYSALSKRLSFPPGVYSRRAFSGKMIEIWIELTDLYHLIHRIPAWTEKNHLADDLGINDVLVVLFLGIHRRAADDSFTPPWLLCLLQTLKNITPSALACDISQLQHGCIGYV